MGLTPELLTGYLRAEFSEASTRRVLLFFLQICIALPAAISVVTVDATLIYFLAIGGGVLLLIWWLVFVFYQRARDAAQTARRASLIVNGLGYRLSADETLAFQSKMTVSQNEAEKFRKADYYYTQLPTGSPRLAEMLHESAFYSAHLQRISGYVMLGILVVFGITFAAIAFAALPYVEQATALTIMRIFLALVVFAMSADVLGACISHRRAATEIERVQSRLQVARKDGYPPQDVMMIMGDYNSAVEGAPESVPFAYRLAGKSLEQRWGDYIANVHKV